MQVLLLRRVRHALRVALLRAPHPHRLLLHAQPRARRPQRVCLFSPSLSLSRSDAPSTGTRGYVNHRL